MSKLKLILLATVLTFATHFVLSQPVSGSSLPFKFQNNYLKFEPPGLFDFLKWRWNALVDGHPKPIQAPIPKVDADLEFIHTNAKSGDRMQPTITWVGHATALVQFAGLNMLTDPIFSERAF